MTLFECSGRDITLKAAIFATPLLYSVCSLILNPDLDPNCFNPSPIYAGSLCMFTVTPKFIYEAKVVEIHGPFIPFHFAIHMFSQWSQAALLQSLLIVDSYVTVEKILIESWCTPLICSSSLEFNLALQVKSALLFIDQVWSYDIFICEHILIGFQTSSSPFFHAHHPW